MKTEHIYSKNENLKFIQEDNNVLIRLASDHGTVAEMNLPLDSIREFSNYLKEDRYFKLDKKENFNDFENLIIENLESGSFNPFDVGMAFLLAGRTHSDCMDFTRRYNKMIEKEEKK